MGKEKVMVCLDNSEWSRNGDYSPNRMETQLDSVNLICGRKTRANRETQLGLLSMAGKSPKVHLTLTSNLGKLLSTLTKIEIEGNLKFTTSIRIAQLALKRRSDDQTANAERRIIAFVASPLKESIKDLELLGARLKKRNIMIDVINYGEHKVNTKKLTAFLVAVNGEEKTSNLLTVPEGPHHLPDLILSSRILSSGSSTSSGSSGSGGNSNTSNTVGSQFDDPNMDPDLALALRLSMEDEQRRQASVKGVKKTTTQTATSSSTSKKEETKKEEVMEIVDDEEESESEDEDSGEDLTEEEMLKRAIELSLKDQNEDEDDDMEVDEELYGKEEKMEDEKEEKKEKEEKEDDEGEEEDDEEDDEDLDEEQIKLALELSKKQPVENKEDISEILGDDDYLKSVIGSLGVNADEVLEKKNEKKDEEK